MASKETKQFGLIIPKKEKNKSLFLSKPSIFDDDSDEASEKSVEKSILNQGLKNLQKRQTQLEMQRALEEDPTVYEYDTVFDSLQKKKEVLKTIQTKDKKPKYIDALMKSADQRKKDYERRIERKIQKEREAEGDEFADKEAFVTTAYKQKMIEMQEEEEREKHQNDIDAKNDVMKQNDLSSFYRHMLKEKVGEAAIINEPEGGVKIKIEKEDEPHEGQSSSSHNLDEAARMALERSRVKNKNKPRHSQNADVAKPSDNDSEFSVDSDSSSTETEPPSENEKTDQRGERKRKKDGKGNRSSKILDTPETSEKNKKMKKIRLDSNIENNIVEVAVTSENNNLDQEKNSEVNEGNNSNKIEDKENLNSNSSEEKKISTAEKVRNLFKKRNVGEQLEAAKERYLARKNAREMAKTVFSQ